MAKMHSRAHGRSGSRKPGKRTKPVWLRFKPAEVELIAAKLAKEGNNASRIGLILRDSYGIPDFKAVTGKRIGEFLKEKGFAPQIPDDLVALMKKAVLVKKHLEKHKHDMHAKRGLMLTESKIFRLAKYYKRIGKLPSDWKYDAERIALLAE
ncbi:MAG: 30S ribosomal protein S15 [Candidatus Woesearchaeota archaeon]